MDLGLISESHEPSGADPRGAQIPLYSIETSDFGLWPIYTYIEDFRKTRRPSNRRAGAHTTHMAHSSSIRVEANTKSVHFNTTRVMGTEFGENNGRFLGQSYMAHFGLFLTRHVGMGISSSALSNHTVTISVLIEAVTFFNSLCASHSVS
jgi:hypothetical protein